MEELIDLMISDASPSQISDSIKDVLFAKASEKIDEIKPQVANSLFNNKE
jgi:hypothetical protein